MVAQLLGAMLMLIRATIRNTGFSSLARAGVDFVALRRPHKVAPNTATDQETLNHFM